jgi:hypothetical protein
MMTMVKYQCQCDCGCEQGYDYQYATICTECQNNEKHEEY